MSWTKTNLKMPYPIYKVGEFWLWEDVFENLKNKKYLAFVYYFDNSGYQGGGLSAGLTIDGKIEYCRLAYNSYGFHSESSECSIEEFLRLKFSDSIYNRKRTPKDYDYIYWKKVTKRIKSLCKKHLRLGHFACHGTIV